MELAYVSWRVDAHREIFGIHYMPHGVFIALGFLLGSWLMVRQARKRGYDGEAIWTLLTWVLVGSLVGMRVAWLAGHLDTVASPLDLVAVWRGGMSLFGGIAGGVVAGVFSARRQGVRALPLIDLAAPWLALGIVIGRFSDLIIGDHLGKPTGLPWGFKYAGTSAPGTPPEIGTVVHPVALYDLMSTLILMVVLVAFLRRERTAGSAAVLFALWYTTGRLAFDFLRVDPVRALGMTGTQLASVAVILGVGGWLLARRLGWPRDGPPGRMRPTPNVLSCHWALPGRDSRP